MTEHDYSMQILLSVLRVESSFPHKVVAKYSSFAESNYRSLSARRSISQFPSSGTGKYSSSKTESPVRHSL